jgi:hypothetical protein
VQSDIDRRRMVRMTRSNEARVRAERDRMAEWLAAYHENADEFGPPGGAPDDEPKTG